MQARSKSEHRVQEVCSPKYFIVSIICFHVHFDKQVRDDFKTQSLAAVLAGIYSKQ